MSAFQPNSLNGPGYDVRGIGLEIKKLQIQLEDARKDYREARIDSRELYLRGDDLGSRIHDLEKLLDSALRQNAAAQYQQMRQAQMNAQQAFTAQAMLQGQSAGLAQAGAQAIGIGLISGHYVPAPPVLPLETEDAFGEVIAWRCWGSAKLPILTSCHITHFIWMPKRVEEADKPVGDYNAHGFHAWNDERTANYYAMALPVPVVIGRVKLWGEVIHHERGYRAQYAKIMSLDTLVTHVALGPGDTRDTSRALKSLQQRYGVAA